ncbi:MAG: hypothetical protein RLZZ127_86 [Planctomycetota bacterium]|jgi:anti-sigma regulatory factor (Ser/Thr protein kinase)
MPALRILPGPPPLLGAPTWSRAWPARAEEAPQRAAEAAAAIMAAGPVAADDEPWLRLCMDEVVVNAIIHGNDADPDLEVRADLWIREGGWAFRIADRGTGFAPEQVPDPADPRSLLLEHGRGIRIMLDWLDELIYYHGGSTAHLARRYR